MEIENLSGLSFDITLAENGSYRPSTSACLLRGGYTTAVVLRNVKGASRHGQFKVKINNFVPHAGSVLETEIAF